MLGWEFPPYISGGLGTACYGLTRGLDQLGVEVLFVLPKSVEASHTSHVRLISPAQLSVSAMRSVARRSHTLETFTQLLENVTFHQVDADLRPYDRPDATTEELVDVPGPDLTVSSEEVREKLKRVLTAFDVTGGTDYAGNLFAQVVRYADLAREIATEQDYDLIHAHDWMTYLAAINAAEVSGKPLVVHVHSTEFDRSGVHVDQRIYDIERAGMHRADRIVAVSYLTKSIVTKHYGIDARKVDVVYNAIDDNGPPKDAALSDIRRDEKIVLFLGRITMQKGPEFFLAAAKRVLEVMDNVRFIMAGSGDMIKQMIALATRMGIGDKVLFTGFLRGDDVKRVFRMADLYVMPSVSEPFGIAPLEALVNDVPVLISKQSGVAEVIRHALKVDFWDVDEMANKIVAVLRHPPLQATLRDHGSIEVRRLSWQDAAANCVEVYQRVLSG